MKKLVAAFVIALATVTAACGSDSSSSTTSSSGTSGTTPAANAVQVSSNKFTPTSITIKKGETVTWTWAGGSHDVVSGPNCMNDNKFTRSPLQSASGATFAQKFDTAGTFEFFCEPHCLSSGMKGTVVVQ